MLIGEYVYYIRDPVTSLQPRVGNMESVRVSLPLLCIVIPFSCLILGTRASLSNQLRNIDYKMKTNFKKPPLKEVWYGVSDGLTGMSSSATSEFSNVDEPSLIELLQGGPWTIVSFSGIDQNEPGFARVGRNTRDEELVFKETSRSPPFAPRLGRSAPTYNTFSPRLGRICPSASN